MVYRTRFLITEEGRQCSRCEIYKPWSEFRKNKHGTRGYQSWCDDCFREHRGSKKRKDYVINGEGRECSTCGQFKPWNDFHRRHDLSFGHMSRCKVCVKRLGQTAQGQQQIRNADLIRKYDISLIEYEHLLSEQNERCAICGKAETRKMNGKPTWLSVDHNHETGKVRGLLCHSCNMMIGVSMEDTGILQRAIVYLDTHNE